MVTHQRISRFTITGGYAYKQEEQIKFRVFFIGPFLRSTRLRKCSQTRSQLGLAQSLSVSATPMSVQECLPQRQRNPYVCAGVLASVLSAATSQSTRMAVHRSSEAPQAKGHHKAAVRTPTKQEPYLTSSASSAG